MFKRIHCLFWGHHYSSHYSMAVGWCYRCSHCGKIRMMDERGKIK